MRLRKYVFPRLASQRIKRDDDCHCQSIFSKFVAGFYRLNPGNLSGKMIARSHNPYVSRVFSSETLFIPHTNQCLFLHRFFQPLPFRQSRFPAKNSRLPSKPIPDESRANRQTNGKSPCYTLAEGSGPKPDARHRKSAERRPGRPASTQGGGIRHVFLRAAIGNGMRERFAVPGISDRHERAIALEQMGRRGHIHRATGRSDRLRLAPYRGRGTGAGTWFQWVKTYSCLAGAVLGC